MKITLKILVPTKNDPDKDLKLAWITPKKNSDRKKLKEKINSDIIILRLNQEENIFFNVMDAIFRVYAEAFTSKEEKEILTKDYLEIGEAYLLYETFKELEENGTPEEKEIISLIKQKMQLKKLELLVKKEVV